MNVRFPAERTERPLMKTENTRGGRQVWSVHRKMSLGFIKLLAGITPLPKTQNDKDFV